MVPDGASPRSLPPEGEFSALRSAGRTLQALQAP